MHTGFVHYFAFNHSHSIVYHLTNSLLPLLLLARSPSLGRSDCSYTGTEICCDPVAKVFTIFLTNRVYPNPNNNQMLTYRRAFNNAVIEVLASNPEAHQARYQYNRDAQRVSTPKH
jgi:hypothetical protein